MIDNISFRIANVDDDRVIAELFYQLWLDNQVTIDGLVTNWLDVCLEFIELARKNLFYQSFIAESSDTIIGSASCQLFAGLYPHVLTKTQRHYGYIWGVYVIPKFRQRGIGKQLTQLCVNHLRSLGCTRAVLNASPSGKPVYGSLGFVDSNGMHLDLI